MEEGREGGREGGRYKYICTVVEQTNRLVPNEVYKSHIHLVWLLLHPVLHLVWLLLHPVFRL